MYWVGRLLMENGKLKMENCFKFTLAGEVSARKGLKRRLGILAQQQLVNLIINAVLSFG